MNIFQQGTPVQTLLPDSSGAVLDVVSLHTNTNAAPPPEEHTTSIILVSNLVAVHPDINMTVGVLDSALLSNISKDSRILHLYIYIH